MDHSPSWPHLHGRDQPNCSISHDGSDGIGSPSVVENVECLSGVSEEVPSEDSFADDETGFGQAALDHSCRGDILFIHGDHVGFAADDSFHVSVSGDSLRVGRGVWNQMVTSAFHQFKCLPDNLKLPWEQGVMSDILGPADFPRLPKAVNQPFFTVEDLGSLQCLNSMTLLSFHTWMALVSQKQCQMSEISISLTTSGDS